MILNRSRRNAIGLFVIPWAVVAMFLAARHVGDETHERYGLRGTWQLCKDDGAVTRAPCGPDATTVQFPGRVTEPAPVPEHVWYQRSFQADESTWSSGGALYLGALYTLLVDVYVNGEYVGQNWRSDADAPTEASNPYWFVPPELLRTGDNVLALRVHHTLAFDEGLFDQRMLLGPLDELEPLLVRSEVAEDVAIYGALLTFTVLFFVLLTLWHLDVNAERKRRHLALAALCGLAFLHLFTCYTPLGVSLFPTRTLAYLAVWVTPMLMGGALLRAALIQGAPERKRFLRWFDRMNIVLGVATAGSVIFVGTDLLLLLGPIWGLAIMSFYAPGLVVLGRAAFRRSSPGSESSRGIERWIFLSANAAIVLAGFHDILIEYDVFERPYVMFYVQVVGAIVASAAALIEFANIVIIESDRLELRRDMELASTVQRMFLPRPEQLRSDWCDIQVSYLPAKFCTGDWWGISAPSPGQLRVAVGDVAGHGVASAMVTGVVATSVQTAPPDIPTAELLERIHRQLATMAEGSSHVTFGVFDLRATDTGYELAWSSAGAPPILVLRQATGKVETVAVLGSPLGGTELAVGHTTVPIAPGDQIIAFTDGAYEFNHKGGKRHFGLASLTRTVAKLSAVPAGEFLPALLEALRAAQGASEFEDDIFLLRCQVRPPAAAGIEEPVRS